MAGTTRAETIATTKKVYPAASGPNTKQPYKFTLPAENARTETFQVDMQFMGHYEEKNLRLNVNMAELVEYQTIVYEMVMDS